MNRFVVVPWSEIRSKTITFCDFVAAVRASNSVSALPCENSTSRRICCTQAIGADGSNRMDVVLLQEHGGVQARVPIVGGNDMAALGKGIIGHGVDVVDELNKREQRGWHVGGTTLCFSTIPIKSKNVTGRRAVQTELFEVILEGLRRIEATTAMFAPIPASALIQVHTLPNVNVRREIIRQLCGKGFNLPKCILLVASSPLSFGQAPGRLRMKAPSNGLEPLQRHLGHKPRLKKWRTAVPCSFSIVDFANTNEKNARNPHPHLVRHQGVPPLGTARVGIRRLRGVSVGVFAHAIDERIIQQQLQNAESRRAIIRNVPGSGGAFVAGG